MQGVVIDTAEALDGGDLKLVTDTSDNYVGLLGDVIAGNAKVGDQKQVTGGGTDDSNAYCSSTN
jgi:hypothetical protein